MVRSSDRNPNSLSGSTPLQGKYQPRFLTNYAGRWVAVIGNQVIGQGGTPSQALQAALSARFKETPEVFYVPTTSPIQFAPPFDQVCAALPKDPPVFLVGGAVRDHFLGRYTRDMDFVLPRDALSVARKVANALGGAYYTLDEARQIGRVILTEVEGKPMVLDFANFRGDSLESDLAARDFTVNAMAVAVEEPDKLLDPLGGIADLHAKRIRACSANTFLEDPLRILRAIRHAADLGFHIHAETRQLMRQAVRLLSRISPERLRDELFRILDGPKPASSILALDMLGVLSFLLPELSALSGESQSPPHTTDVWNHTLDVLRRLEEVIGIFSPKFDLEGGGSLMVGMISMRLARFRQQIQSRLNQMLNPDRSLRSLLFMAALYHDAGKPATRKIDEQNRIRFIGHEKISAELVHQRARALRLSNHEANRLEVIVHQHMRPIFLTQTGELPSRRAVYRFFRDTGESGVDICLLSLADIWATYGSALPEDIRNRHLDVLRILLEAWWENPNVCVSPPVLITGNDLINEFRLRPGAQIGRLLEDIREAQAVGKVHNRQEALEYARERISDE